MLQNCASECVNHRTYRTLQETCDVMMQRVLFLLSALYWA